MNTVDLSGKIVLVTGANTGIGRVTARELAKQGAQVFIACRQQARCHEVLADIAAQGGKAEWLALDLGDLASVRRCAEQFLARNLPLHLLINNAGVAGGHGLTASGFELAFGTNHLGHFLLTELLRPRLIESAPARIITVSSRAHYRAPAIDWAALQQPTQSTTGLPEYSVSKLANILFTTELARQLAGSGVTCHALHPGVIASEIWREVPALLRVVMKWFMVSTEKGAQTTLYCATAPELAQQSGLYYDRCASKIPSRAARDPELARQLWQRSSQWVAQE